MINFSAIYLVIGAVFLYVNLLFILALLVKKNDIMDIAWGLGFIIITALSLLLDPGYHWRRILVSALVTLWGARLLIYIYLRNKGKNEDFRYAKWRNDWGKNWVLRSYLQVFLLQGFFMLTIAYPLFLFNQGQFMAFGFLDVIGLLIWLIGFGFEAIGDAQMRKFKANPKNKGKIMNKGLWKLTRHPNYFGESAMWWGIFIIGLSNMHGWLAIFSPIIITTLLLRVSGVPMLEKKYKDNPAYQRYIQKTSSFVPWFPRKKL
ncbi:DUF1295 domain-containing protein [Candidatus Cloacimonadota bacterium]